MYLEQRQLQVRGTGGGSLPLAARGVRAAWWASLAVTAGLLLEPRQEFPAGEVLQVRLDHWAHTLVWAWLALLPFLWERRRARAARLALLMPLYGLLLEFAQILVPGRSCELSDFLSELAGTLAGMASGALLARLLRFGDRPGDRPGA